MCVRFIGCLHLGHKNVITRFRGFESVEDYHEHLVKEWNSVVRKNDVVYILGDITMESNEEYPILDRLKGVKRVVLGNHDLGKHVPDLLNHVSLVTGAVKYKGFWLTHIPIHPQELIFVRGNIHAHIHNMTIPYTEVEVNHRDNKELVKSSSNNKYYNVDAHLIDYKPKTIEELLKNK